jgi:hypothetical protein
MDIQFIANDASKPINATGRLLSSAAVSQVTTAVLLFVNIVTTSMAWSFKPMNAARRRVPSKEGCPRCRAPADSRSERSTARGGPHPTVDTRHPKRARTMRPSAAPQPEAPHPHPASKCSARVATAHRCCRSTGAPAARQRAWGGLPPRRP